MQVRLDDRLKAAADKVFAGMGLDTSTAIRMFLTASVEQRRLPFDVRTYPSDEGGSVPPKMSREDVFGCMRGQFRMADDFDAPLEDFREYMQ